MRKHFLIFTVGAVAVATSLARPARDNEVVYFSDKTMKTEVGSFYMACSGKTFRTGRTTKFYVRYQEACPGSALSGMGPNCYTFDRIMAVS